MAQRLLAGWLVVVAGIAFAATTSRSVDLIAPQRGDSLFPRYTIQVDSVLGYGNNGSVIVKQCGVGKLYLRVASHGQWIAADTVTVNACNLLPCDSVYKMYHISADTSIMPLACRRFP
jgi:hypothetical protein